MSDADRHGRTFAVSAPGGLGSHWSASRALRNAVGLWFLVAVIGQWVFALYVATFYGGAAARGDLQAWSKVLPHGYVPGDPVWNVALAAHLLLAVIISVGGALQLVPQLRARALPFHRWNGRVYITTAFVISLAGLYLAWAREVPGGLVNATAVTINAVLIMLCAAMTLRYALVRDIASHRRWALRTFIAASGVWFFRVGLALWIFLNGGPVGVGRNLDGPFAIAWAFGQYLLPLAVLELYLRAKNSGGPLGRYAMAATLFVFTIGMGVGIYMVAASRWLPRI